MFSNCPLLSERSTLLLLKLNMHVVIHSRPATLILLNCVHYPLATDTVIRMLNKLALVTQDNDVGTTDDNINDAA